MLQAEALAKINRELRVGPLRSDGYHGVHSLLVSIDLADRIEVEPDPELSLRCEGTFPVPSGPDNLVWRAALALARHHGVEPSGRIRLEKRIPTGAGLGGGSADAAIALRLLASLWKLSPATEKLLPVAEELGSDVPFFLYGGEAEVSGRGERVTAREDAVARDLLLVVPPFSIRTADVYAALDRIGLTGEAARRLEVDESDAFFGPNDLALAVQTMEPRMETYLRSVVTLGPEFAITGSGSAIVVRGVSDDSGEWLAQRHPEARLIRCRTVGRAEYRRRTSSSGGSRWR